MPELPEVQRVCLTIAPLVVGRRVRRVNLNRSDVVTGPATPADLLAGTTLTEVRRHGKQIALLGPAGRPAVCIHLGMTGSLVAGPDDEVEPDRHVHVEWLLEGGTRLRFRDPRRFGGIWTCPDFEALRQSRWRQLGEDALTIAPRRLHQRLGRTRRPLKAALLDQQLIAGLGNIYVDELLYACRLSPLLRADELTLQDVQRMVPKMRRLLQRAIRAGGSSVRDYVGGDGAKGGFQLLHQAYGRASQPCRTCSTPLAATRIAGRTTVFCPQCQHERQNESQNECQLPTGSNPQ